MTIHRRNIAVFQHTAARRRLAKHFVSFGKSFVFQHTAARRRLGPQGEDAGAISMVSTHSRPKAAGSISASTCSST